MNERELAGRLLGARLNRREVLTRALALGLSAPAIGALLAACGGSDDAATATTDGASASPAGGASSPAATTATGAGSGGQTGGTLVIGANIDDMITFDPGSQYEVTSQQVMYALHQSLVFQAPDDLNAYVPVLAEEVPTKENGGISADGLTYTFKLRKGVTFHSGNEMKADDWVFSMNRLHFLTRNPSFLADPFVKRVDPNDPSKDVVQVSKVDDYTVAFTLTQPNVAFLAYLATTSLTTYDAKVAREHGALATPAAAKDDTAQEWLNNNSLGAGPFKLTSFKNKEEVVLERFADYWGPRPGYDKIVFRHVVDSGSQLQQLQAGEIQIAQGLDADAIASLAGQDGLTVVTGDTLNHNYLALHTAADVGGPLADPRVRQAVAYAIDYDGIINDLLGGAAVRPASPVPLGLLAADRAETLKYTLNLDKAKQLVQEAGVAGQTISFSFGSGGSTDGVANETLASKLQADIEQCGLKVELVPMEPQQRLADFRAAKLQFTFSGWSPDYVDVHTYAQPFGGVADSGASKRVKYVSAANTALLEQGLLEFDPRKRSDIYYQIQQNMITDAPFIVLWQTVFQIAMSSKVTGYRIHPVTLVMLDEITPA